MTKDINNNVILPMQILLIETDKCEREREQIHYFLFHCLPDVCQ